MTVSTHSRAEAAAFGGIYVGVGLWVSTHSRAEAAADLGYSHLTHKLCFNTQPRGGGCTNKNNRPCYSSMFQHTAARRRLPSISTPFIFKTSVSTHSRAEAAATSASNIRSNDKCFNTQPRGGGCLYKSVLTL